MTNGEYDSILEMPEHEQDVIRSERYDAQHPDCEWCKESTCAENDDGTRDCSNCEHDAGEPIKDDHGVIGYVHPGCREQYISELLVCEIVSALMVRKPLGLDTWVNERARNLAARLQVGFKIGLKP
jgi:hypothetical protein